MSLKPSQYRGIFPDHYRAISASVMRRCSRPPPSARGLPVPPTAPPLRTHSMQIHVLIPVPPPDSTGPDPPDIYHYTTGLKLRSIINSGVIKPSTAQVPPNEKPVAWFSTSPEWEPTATKVPIPGKPGQLVTAKAQGGLVRITVPMDSVPYRIQQLPKIAGTSLKAYAGLILAGLELGADPGAWRFTPTPVPSALFREVEFYDFASDRWLAIDLAELACRN